VEKTEKILTNKFVVVDSSFRLAAYVPRVNDVVFVVDLFRFQRQMLNGSSHFPTKKRPTRARGNVRTKLVFIYFLLNRTLSFINIYHRRRRYRLFSQTFHGQAEDASTDGATRKSIDFSPVRRQDSYVTFPRTRTCARVVTFEHRRVLFSRRYNRCRPDRATFVLGDQMVTV